MLAARSTRIAFLHTAAFSLAFSLGWLATGSVCHAQPKDLNSRTADVTKMLREGQLSDPALFDEYFVDYLFPQFTRPTARGMSLEDLQATRKKLKNILSQSVSGPVHDKLNSMVYAEMGKLIGGNHGKYDAVIKLNAMYMLADLNDDEGKEGSKVKPYSKSFKGLHAAVEREGFPDYLKFPALYGVWRFAYLGAPEAKKPEVTATLLKLMNQKQPPDGRDRKVHDWMRSTAGQALSELGATTPDPDVVTAMQAIVDDANEDCSLRCYMATYLGWMKYPPESKIDTASLASSLGHMMFSLSKHEIEHARQTGMLPPKYKLAWIVDSALKGLGKAGGSNTEGKGVVAAAKGSQGGKFVDSVQAKVQSIQVWLDSPEFVDGHLMDEFPVMLADLETILGQFKKQDIATTEARTAQ